MVQLQIKKSNLDLIKSGQKKTEWRQFSVYNKKLLFKKRDDNNLYEGNADIKEIKFLNGYAADRATLSVEVKRIRLVKFSSNINIPEDNFTALEGQFAIEITLGNILDKK